MKKVISVIVCVCTLICIFAGCMSTTSNAASDQDDRMILVERSVHNNGTCTAYMLVDRETGVAYLAVHGSGITAMVDELGHPVVLYDYRNT